MSKEWTETDQQILLDALCESVSTAHAIEIVQNKTEHSTSTIRNKLVAMGAIEERLD
ncbi:hypothetical protein [Vibrio owensii]|uniref:hypothetical protein n=1 Tax=Vibrio owensii TaxID=696485 RepID=UPI0018F15200|nr:hypothetical protein [Vibrio owensii]